ncbi:hypothetical protein N7470_007940 [Penicillium chermesinum]|nr:hypothetical protein N7470_007940 [Penicillium chermesinum]
MRVFPVTLDAPGSAGNPTTVFLNAGRLTSVEMQQLAQACKHECGFVVAGPVLAGNADPPRYNVSIKFWVPGHEMEMCGHATIGALWLMDRLGMFANAPNVSVSTKAGTYEALLLPEIDKGSDGSMVRKHICISQPRGTAKFLSQDACQLIAEALDISTDKMADLEGVQNAITSRTKTLVPLKDVETLNSLQPSQDSVRHVCETIGSTGLYPYAMVGDTTFSARQFPKSSGYLEDPATGIAATALVCGLLRREVIPIGTTEPIIVMQGWAMGCPSEIRVKLRRASSGDVVGYWLTGNVVDMQVDEPVLSMLNRITR